MINPLCSITIWSLSEHYLHEAQRDAYLTLAQSIWERTYNDWLGQARPDDTPDDVAEYALRYTFKFLKDHAKEIDETILAEAGTDDRSNWYAKPFVKAAVYEYLNEYELTDEEVAKLMHQISEALATRLVQVAPDLSDEDRAYEVSGLTLGFYLGARAQQGMLDAIGLSESMKKAGDLQRSIGKDEERIVFEQYVARMCSSLGISFDDQEDAEHEVFLYYINNKEEVVASLRGQA